MIVVSDTSPLNYLILIGQDRILPAIFPAVIAPPEVLEELRHGGAPEAVRTWAAKPPSWLEVKRATAIDPSLALGKGELAAISLAIELQPNNPKIRLLIDERDGRDAARKRGLEVAGTLTVMAEASLRGLIDLPTAIEALKRTSFHAKPSLLDEVLRMGRADRLRRSTDPPTDTQR